MKHLRLDDWIGSCGCSLLTLLVLTPAVSAMDLGDTVDFLVPDISYFPEPLQTRQFTCRAITGHAYWLVQDTTFIDLADSSMDFQVIWGGLMTQAELDSITAQFEGSGVSVYETVTSLYGPMPVTINDDDRIWIVFADIPDYYPNPAGGAPTRVGNCVYTWPEDFDGDDGTGNDHDIFYVNLGIYKNMPGTTWAAIRGSVHTWSIPTGLGQILRIARNRLEETWLIRGLGVFAQFYCYGLTSAFNGLVGIEAYLDGFSTAGGIELVSWCSGQRFSDFGENLGGELLWLEYLQQRVGSGLIPAIVQSDETGMLNVARAVDPTVPDSVAVAANVFPLYEDWLITNLVAHISGGFAGGIYRYDFLDGTGYTFTVMDSPATFLAEFNTYPFPTWIASTGYYGMSAQVFSAQYASFGGDYTSGGNDTVWFDGMYNQNNGSGPNLDGNWVAWRVVLSDDSTLLSVDSLEFDELFNGTIQLTGSKTFVVLTSNNPGGTAHLRYTFSQDTAPKSMFLTALQNAMNQQYLQAYASLFREDTQMPYGFDWVGPDLEISHLDETGEPDSTATVDMQLLSSTLWTGQVYAWDAGNYKLACTGWDSLGIAHTDTLQFAVGFGGTGTLMLDIGQVRMEISEGVIPPGSMASIVETGLFGLSVVSGIPLSSSDGFLAGILEGPVSVSPAEGLVSFPSETPEGSVFRLDGEEWQQLDSYFQSGRMCAPIEGGGIYALGSGPGISSPSVPPELILLGSFPNPFSTQAAIAFSMPEAGPASISVFDMAGRLIRSLDADGLTVGVNSLVWDGCDGSGIPVAAGVYFCRLEASGRAEVVKILRIGGE